MKVSTEHSLPPPLRPLAFPAWWERLEHDQRGAGQIKDLPRITVITPSYQQADFLEATIRSVLAQGYPNLDYHVIDGGSKDGSVEVIKHYEKYLSSWVSERDSGQVDAICKGIDRADGQWINWINSDDLLAPGTLWEVAALSASNPDLLTGSTQDFLGDKFAKKRVSREFSARNFVRLPLGSPTRWHQPGIWYRTATLREVGIPKHLHFRFDLDLLIRYLHRFPKVSYTKKTFAYFRLHPASKTISKNNKFGEEHQAILKSLIDDPATQDLSADAREALVGLDWRDQLSTLQRDQSRSRWERARTLMQKAANHKGAWRINVTRDVLAKIIFRGR